MKNYTHIDGAVLEAAQVPTYVDRAHPVDRQDTFALEDWVRGSTQVTRPPDGGYLIEHIEWIDYDHGKLMKATPGDWVIKGTDGWLVCTPDEFAAEFTPAK